VGKIYDNGTSAVEDFNLGVEKGEFIAFLGPSGCGKTTTLRMIAGFEAITSGDILIRGQRINDMPPERRPTSMIFQNYALFPHMTVRGNVGYGLDVKGLPKAERDAKVDRILDKLGLSDLADSMTQRLSGGQRQRIALARGLVVEPAILLLDEPLGALDANLRKTIQAELKLLQRNLGITFVFVTHAQSEALTLSDRIVVMNRGRIEQVSSPLQLYTRPQTPFVAQFIGRNTIIEGALGKVETGRATLSTRFGTFVGAPNNGPVAGRAAKIVIPSESLEIFSVTGTSQEALTAEYEGNLLPGVLERANIVGHLMQIGIALDEGDRVALEAHVDKYRREDLVPSSHVWIAWRAKDATIIAA
ncbi:MAG: ABC transporter ATP-binding protein, partial [Bradyrhizobium sp.]|uniref:ABC transporter ATP-binding protein n=1 Tax=Bradyrhizobium sp. TaxID=376 RepID=UPI001D2F2A2D